VPASPAKKDTVIVEKHLNPSRVFEVLLRSDHKFRNLVSILLLRKASVTVKIFFIEISYKIFFGKVAAGLLIDSYAAETRSVTFLIFIVYA